MIRSRLARLGNPVAAVTDQQLAWLLIWLYIDANNDCEHWDGVQDMNLRRGQTTDALSS